MNPLHIQKIEEKHDYTKPYNIVSINHPAIKRGFDIVSSFIGSILLLPLFMILAIIIYIDDPNASPIFVQTRVGKGGRHFKMYKFRSMVADAEVLLKQLSDKNEMDGPAFKIRKDPRTTRFGRLIRSTNLDELPQLWNVLKGEMSLVGPRPPLPSEVAQYTPEQMKRISITPGMTCYWQTKNDRNSLSFDEWMELDMKYIREKSAAVDLKILLRTCTIGFHRNKSNENVSETATA